MIAIYYIGSARFSTLVVFDKVMPRAPLPTPMQRFLTCAPKRGDDVLEDAVPMASNTLDLDDVWLPN